MCTHQSISYTAKQLEMDLMGCSRQLFELQKLHMVACVLQLAAANQTGVAVVTATSCLRSECSFCGMGQESCCVYSRCNNCMTGEIVYRRLCTSLIDT